MKKKILLTGASGLLGHYLLQTLTDADITQLGIHTQADIQCNLEEDIPLFTDRFNQSFDTVIHAAGTSDENNAVNLNFEGTRRLLQGLSTVAVRKFVYISCYSVYGNAEKSMITEDEPLHTSDKTGQSIALAEAEIKKFCDEKGIICTILRPATMFGKDMSGWGATMANQVLRGYYFNIRDYDADVSIVTALDVARIIPLLAEKGGTYNVTDGITHSMQQLSQSMGCNRGESKRALFLPLKWARIIARIGDRLPLTSWLIDSNELRRRVTSITFSTQRLQETLPDFKFHDTEAVIAHRDPDYPYEDD